MSAVSLLERVGQSGVESFAALLTVWCGVWYGRVWGGMVGCGQPNVASIGLRGVLCWCGILRCCIVNCMHVVWNWDHRSLGGVW